MRRKYTRISAVLLAAVLTLFALPLAVFSAETPAEETASFSEEGLAEENAGFSAETPAEETAYFSEETLSGETAGFSAEETQAEENSMFSEDGILLPEAEFVEAPETENFKEESSDAAQAGPETDAFVPVEEAPAGEGTFGQDAETPVEESAVQESASEAPLETVVDSVDAVTEETDVDHPDNEELFDEYAESVFEEAAGAAADAGAAGSSQTGTKKSKKATGASLTGQDRVIYDALLARAAEVAAGREASTVVEIPLTDLGIDPDKDYTAEDLGLDYIYRKVDGQGEWNPDVGTAVEAMFTYTANTSRIFHCLWVDSPYELYWHKGGIAWSGSSGYETSATVYGDVYEGYVHLTSRSVTFSMRVESKYRLDDDEFTADTAKTGAASAAAVFAQSIVSDADSQGLSDYDRLIYYKDRICAEVKYNDAAREGGDAYPDGGAWALIYVFDQDPDTNVVCEGYSEAFQYLCELTVFQSSRVCAYCPTGVMTGGTGAGSHKWNIIHMDDGKNYMADVTNSDQGSVGDDGRLFLKGISGSVDGGYSLSWEERQVTEETEGGTRIYTYPAGSISYTYDSDTRALFTDEELTLSAEDYVPGSALPDDPDPVDPGPTVDEMAKIEAASLFLTDRIGMNFHVALDRDHVTENDYMTLVCEGRTIQQKVSETYPDETGRAVFSIELTARQMTDPVTLTMNVGGKDGTPAVYTIRTYADTVLAGTDYSSSEKNVVRAMLNYGKYTQIYAGYHTENLPAQDIYGQGEDPVQDWPQPDLSGYSYSYVLNDKEDGLRIKEATLLLGTEISVRFYYQPGEGKTAEDYRFFTESGEEAESGYDSRKDLYYATVEAFSPRNLGRNSRVDIFTKEAASALGSGSGATDIQPLATVDFSPMSYCRGILESEQTPEASKNLCKAICYYFQAVKAYLDSML
ncbi:MAG: hypothetical protein IJH93_03430 [Lachnospiraceae bacterium]|nr:hypothetical protein [Lachnospiraceae bacterium]